MSDLKSLATEVLRDSHIMTLAVTDVSGPWASGVIFVHDDEMNLYWLSKSDTRHSRAIASDGRAAAAITASSESDKERALQIEGVAEKIDRPREEVALALATKRGKSAFEQREKILERGMAWYMLKPSRVELIHNELYGYDRQRVL